MLKPLYLKTATIKVSAEHWTQFAALARSQVVSASALLRQLVVKELKRAALEDAFVAQPPVPVRRAAKQAAK